MLQHIKALFDFLFGWTWRWRRQLVYRGQHVADLPDKLARDIVYIVSSDGHDWSAAMLCPGGCGKTLEMNLLPDAKPFWILREHPDRLVGLRPSVWLKTGCGCHYVLTEGRVRWA
jgi:Family of unknown function (DUF6527)